MALAGEVKEGSGNGGGIDDAGSMHAICFGDELLDVFDGEGVVVDADVVEVALEGRVGRELAASEVVADGAEVGGTGLDDGVACHLLAVEVDGDGALAEGDGDVAPAVGAESGGAELHGLLGASVLDGEAWTAAGIHGHEDVVVGVGAEVKEPLPGGASAPVDPGADGELAGVGDGGGQLEVVLFSVQ